MDLDITGRRALVTGADGAIGAAIAERLADEGVELLLTGLDADGLDRRGADVAEHGDVIGTIVADLTEPGDLQRLESVLDEHGGVDICVHAAGETGPTGPPLDLSDDDWYETWSTDFLSAVRVARLVVPAMRSTGWGRLVFVSSENARQPYVDEMPYNVSKAGINAFTKGLGQHLAPAGILVNAVAPAFVESPMTDAMMEQRADERDEGFDETIETFLDEERPHLVLERRGRPDEVAVVVALLCSSPASFTVGSVYRVDGGSVASVDG